MGNMEKTKIAIIGGTGFSEHAQDFEEVKTDYGNVNVAHMNIGGKDVLFLARHQALEVPHIVNYKANMQALKIKGINTIFAVSACGRLAQEVLPGHIVRVSDVDWDDLNRDTSFAQKGLLLHASMYEAFSESLGNIITESWNQVEDEINEIYDESLSLGYHPSGTYFNIQGPAFTTPSREARLRDTVKNAKVIGMTLVPEVHLAREMSMAYAAIGMCVDNSNFPDAPPVHHADGVMHAVLSTAKAAYVLLDKTIANMPDDFHDPISHEAYKHAIDKNQVDFGMLKDNGRENLADIMQSFLYRI